jgi:uncharacterized protein YndB with AHSA1/START domain
MLQSEYIYWRKIELMTDKTKIQLEYVLNCSPKVLFNWLSTASGLAEWFADDVQVKGKKFTFIWEGSEQSAEMTLHKENKLVRFTWLDEEDGYFEFRISQDELTSDVSLLVIDFAEEDELDETKGLWDTQIADLKHILGS